MALGATILGTIIFAVMGLLLYMAQADKLGDNTRPAILMVFLLLPVGMFCGYVSYQPEEVPHFDGPQTAESANKKKRKRTNPFGGGSDDGEADYADEAGKDTGARPDEGGDGGAAKPQVEVKKAIVKEAFEIGREFQDCQDCPVMMVVPAGYFTMGSADSDTEAPDHEKPALRVKIARRLGIGRFEVTVHQYESFIRETSYASSGSCDVLGRPRRVNYAGPGFPQDSTHPVVCVSWVDAQAYLSWLGNRVGKPYRLLSAAEWEYVARAGTASAYAWGDQLAETDANFGAKQKGTQIIGSYAPNKFKVSDMHGNAAEWVEDCWSDDLSVARENGAAFPGVGGCSSRVVKGGSWRDKAFELRAAARRPMRQSSASDTVGFRVARAVNNGPVVSEAASTDAARTR